MEKSRFTFISIFAIFIFSIFGGCLAFADDISGTTQGSLSALGSGYGIGRWPYSDGDVPVGSSVTVRVATLDPDVTHVILVWKAGEDVIYQTGKIAVSLSSDTWGTDPIYDAYDTQVLSVAGDWGVQAYYYDDWDAPFGDSLASGKVAIRAISYHPVIPEVPYGTIASMITMLGALVVLIVLRGRVP